MNVSTINPTHTPDLLHVFAYRIARKIFLRRFCGEGHPVLTIEENLIEMARSKLQEYMLITYTQEELRNIQPALEKQIKISATQRIMSFDEDYDVKVLLVAELELINFDSIFPSVH